MTFMNRGTQKKKQRIMVNVVVGVVLVAFVASILALTFI